MPPVDLMGLMEVYGSEGEIAVDLVRSQVSAAFLKPQAGKPAGWEFPDLVWKYGYGGEQQHFVDRILGLPDGSVTALSRAQVEAMIAALPRNY